MKKKQSVVCQTCENDPVDLFRCSFESLQAPKISMHSHTHTHTHIRISSNNQKKKMPTNRWWMTSQPNKWYYIFMCFFLFCYLFICSAVCPKPRSRMFARPSAGYNKDKNILPQYMNQILFMKSQCLCMHSCVHTHTHACVIANYYHQKE